MTFNYTPKGVCSNSIDIELDGDIIKSVVFTGGCNGNLKGIGALAQGMNVKDYISRCRGLTCSSRQTSCPDQLACALEAVLAQSEK